MPANETERAILAAFRVESPKVIARVARITGDVGVAEEIAQDVLVTALEQWPASGVPENPGAWLMAAAKHRALNRYRHTKIALRKHGELEHELAAEFARVPAFEMQPDDDIGDDLLRLVFTACHPLLSTEARVALTLRLLGGLTTDEIARAFLVPEPTIAQRIVRAKRTLSDARVAFEVPRGPERVERLASVLGVVYLVFNEGYSATAGGDLVRPELCADALRLGRVLAELTPDEPEVHGLVALMEISAARMATRTDEHGDPVLLLNQDRSRWDPLLIRRGLLALERAEALSSPPAPERGPYVLQAAIAGCHARAGSAGDTDWTRIAALYGELAALTRSPVVELNRAVAVGMAQGPESALPLVDALMHAKKLEGYYPLPSARADLLVKLGRDEEAATEFERARSFTSNARLIERLTLRAAECRARVSKRRA